MGLAAKHLEGYRPVEAAALFSRCLDARRACAGSTDWNDAQVLKQPSVTGPRLPSMTIHLRHTPRAAQPISLRFLGSGGPLLAEPIFEDVIALAIAECAMRLERLENVAAVRDAEAQAKGERVTVL